MGWPCGRDPRPGWEFTPTALAPRRGDRAVPLRPGAGASLLCLRSGQVDSARERKGDLIIPGQPEREERRKSAEQEQSCAYSDQTHSDGDQTSADQDQDAADIDQLAADSDQAASDRDLAHGVDRDAYDSSREARERTTEARRTTSSERHNTASARDVTADERDLSAMERDRAAEARDLEDERRDAEIVGLTSRYGIRRQQAMGRSSRRAARERERQRAEADRERSAMHRVDAGADRRRAAGDRERAASDRKLAAEDRAHATAERKADEIDTVTGARRRAPGLADIRRQIDRAHGDNRRLIAAYVDVDGLKATNDSKGHHAGDLMLKHIVSVIQAHLRSNGQVIRLSGDEFICTIPDARIESVRERFGQITAVLNVTPDKGSISVGFAQLAPGDSPMGLIDRADSDLIAIREGNGHERRART
jgi:diguanylate cyclase (GGDEF)-like protein